MDSSKSPNAENEDDHFFDDIQWIEGDCNFVKDTNDELAPPTTVADIDHQIRGMALEFTCCHLTQSFQSIQDAISMCYNKIQLEDIYLADPLRLLTYESDIISKDRLWNSLQTRLRNYDQPLNWPNSRACMITLSTLDIDMDKILKATRSNSSPIKNYTCDIFGMYHLMISEDDGRHDEDDSTESISADESTKDDYSLLDFFQGDDKNMALALSNCQMNELLQIKEEYTEYNEAISSELIDQLRLREEYTNQILVRQRFIAMLRQLEDRREFTRNSKKKSTKTSSDKSNVVKYYF
ncbi:uncharacterized protein TRIADDRAFT_57127 [Trichoplax adhaerens]|uniref:Uncharacterized protein n=1 Tax=Trichoplax adhaerens TaxID=10228 RepID=B3S0P7_TRIAD|nr:predicted protein [Trichoplax adhaerens]EDV24043.1 predicted protein [Trichoplax adhaerens]|eukprot:XP_002113569.1 predicted protein [Trichoplax adhaerens]